MKDVVAQDQTGRSITDEAAAEDEGICQFPGFVMHRAVQVDAPLAAVAEQALEQILLVRRRDDQNVADTRLHHARKRVVDHRLVVDRQQLFRNHLGERVEPRAGAACENDAFS